MARLLGPSDVRDLADGLDLRPGKRWGQNFVVDAGTVRRIASAAGVGPGEHVVEVGPGLGSLTLALLETGASVTAIEIDPRLASALGGIVAKRAPDDAARLAVVHADALRITVGDVADARAAADGDGSTAPTSLVANLPYNVAVPVVLHALETFPTLRRLLVMVQAEVADRIVAPPGSRTYGIPSAKVAWYGSARRAGDVGRAVFWPVPRVDSALVLIERREPPATTVPRAEVFAVIDAAFAHRRKVLRGAVRALAGSAEAGDAALERAGIDPVARGETLGIDDFARLAEAIGDFRAGEVSGTVGA
jgi:16S rRNA (adenine1518-N6/adenine1519-N6)-dimethyltransferase